jgi:hypothetical protein
MALAFVIITLLLLLSLLWGPTIMVLRWMGKPIRSKLCASLLITELVFTIVLILFTDLFDFNNPFKTLIVAVVLASLVGLFYAMVRAWRRR